MVTEKSTSHLSNLPLLSDEMFITLHKHPRKEEIRTWYGQRRYDVLLYLSSVCEVVARIEPCVQYNLCGIRK
jgi:hypothetical protein